MAKAEAAKEAVAAVAGKAAAEGAAKMGMAVKVKNKKPLGSLFKHDLFLPSPMFRIRSLKEILILFFIQEICYLNSNMRDTNGKLYISC